MKRISSFLLMCLFTLNFVSTASAENVSLIDIKSIPTEQVNPDTVKIDEVSTLEMLRIINNEDKKVANCVSKHLEQVAAAIDAISEKFASGGRIVYMGAGTSGRMGYMDASECPPTFGVSNDRVVALMVGGLTAMTKAIENAEDRKKAE